MVPFFLLVSLILTGCPRSPHVKEAFPGAVGPAGEVATAPSRVERAKPSVPVAPPEAERVVPGVPPKAETVLGIEEVLKGLKAPPTPEERAVAKVPKPGLLEEVPAPGVPRVQEETVIPVTPSVEEEAVAGIEEVLKGLKAPPQGLPEPGAPSGEAEAGRMRAPAPQVVPVPEVLPGAEAVPGAPMGEEVVAKAPEMPLAKEGLPEPGAPSGEAEAGRMRAPAPQVVPVPEVLPGAEAVPGAPMGEEVVAKAPEMPLAKEEIMKSPPEGQAPVPSGLAESLEGLKDVFFDFDKAVIREDMQKVLDENVKWLKANPAAKVLIEGHCDERGTNEYNLGLGERRARAVKDYLVALGVEASRIGTISYGEERPFVLGHDESAWKWNRRAHFVVQ